VEPHVAFDTSVHVRPLVAALPGDRWCALLVNRRTTRILLGDAAEFEELTRYSDDVDGQHASGGIAQPRESRNIEQQVQRHIRDTLDLVEQLRGAGRWQHLLIAAPDELHGAIEQALPDQVRRDFVRWIDCDVERATTTDLAARAHACIEEFEHRGMQRMLDVLLQNAGQHGRASLGIEATLRALNEHRVETLLLAEGFRRPGAICDHGDWLAPGSSACPVHGRTMRPVADVIEVAVEAALRSGARIVTVPRHEEGDLELGLDTREFQQLTSLGQVAAITRFELDETVVPDAWE
jgi:peptide subunit release factor 1 (eRF1)